MASYSELKKILAWAILAASAAGLSYHASQFAIDFGVYYSIAHKVFYQGFTPYRLAPEGMLWPMYYRYPPPFLFIVWPFVSLPFEMAAVVWTLLKSAVLGWFAYGFSRRLGGIGGPLDWLAALCIAGPYVVMEFRYGNVQFLVFALVAGALLCVRERPYLAVLALGAAITTKVWPLFFVPYLIVRRQWRAALGALPVVALLILLPALYFGWSGNLALLDEWYQYESGIVVNASEIWFPSQSLHGLLTRYLSVVDYTQLPDPGYRRVHVASVGPRTIGLLWAGLVAVGYGLLLWLAAKSRSRFRYEVDGIAFCALVLLEPYSQKQSALVVLVWPALVVASRKLRSFPPWGRVCLACAAALGVVQVFLPTSEIHRLFQVLGTDAVLTFLLAAGLLSRFATADHRAADQPAKTLSPSEESKKGEMQTPATREG